MKKQCSNCEFNFDGVCAGSSLSYGHVIENITDCCEDWSANEEYFHWERMVAPRFLRDRFIDCTLSYSSFSEQHEAYKNGEALNINIFDAVKYVYGLSIVDIAVLMGVSYGVVFQAKTKRIPIKRVRQFCDALCISEDVLMSNTTAVFTELYKGRDSFYAQSGIQDRLSLIPQWKQDIVFLLSNDYVHCPIHIAKDLARIDKMYWEKGMTIDDYTESEQKLITYYTKKDSNIISIEYFLDMAGRPHVSLVYREHK